MCPLGSAVQLNPPIKLNVRGAPVLSSSPSRLAVQLQKQIGLRLHLRPAFRIEHTLAICREDVRHSVAIPQDLGVTGRRGPCCHRRSGDYEHRRGDPLQRSIHKPELPVLTYKLTTLYCISDRVAPFKRSTNQ